jgi:uncharacterized protein (TIGR00251 family)
VAVEFPPADEVAWGHPVAGGWRVRLRVQPGARRSEVVGPHGEELKVRVAAPAVDGRANEELVRVVAAWAGVARRRVHVVRGHRSRRKVVDIELPPGGGT